MKKSIFVKSLLVILISLVMAFTATSVYAADTNSTNDFDLLEPVNGTSNSNSNSNNANTNSNANRNNTNTNTNRNNTNNNALRTNNANTYNNTTLPKTGIQDSLPIVLLVAVFGVSAVYAYKKIKDYRNI